MPDTAHHPEDLPEPAENTGKSKEETDDAKKQEVAREDAGKSEEEKSKEVG